MTDLGPHIGTIGGNKAAAIRTGLGTAALAAFVYAFNGANDLTALVLLVLIGGVIALCSLKSSIKIYENGIAARFFPRRPRILLYEDIDRFEWVDVKRRGLFPVKLHTECRIYGKNGKILHSLNSLHYADLRDGMRPVEKKLQA